MASIPVFDALRHPALLAAAITAHRAERLRHRCPVPLGMVAWVCTTVATVAVLAALAAAGRAPAFLRVWAPTIVTTWAGLVALTAAVGLTA